MGVLEAREVEARVHVEALCAEADRILADLQRAEAMLERRERGEAPGGTRLGGEIDAGDVRRDQRRVRRHP
ncbi:hypothetical protein [Streptomyces sp. NPDC058086]|uniref:hypothetical protein n=1 Tax=Streptomyces sp. NPDC058086 TaxID=3346334 RepID=UPI0036EEF84E